MAEAAEELTVAQRLGRLLDRGLLPAGGPAEAAERLIERLERQARVALLGLPGSGKSAILNLLAGTMVVPETLRLPTIIVQHGTEPRMLCTLADGRSEVVPGSDLSQVLRLAPAMVTLEMDIPALKVITLLEVSAGPMEAEQRRAATWAAKRADVIIWCTTSYLPKEQVVWDDMPDVVKDNGFLFLTKVDLLGSREAAQGMLERVEARAGEDFRQVLAISAKQARQALQVPGGLDRELFRDSGAGAVITAIKSRVQMARRADTDMAELLLARHVEASEMVARRFAETGDEKPPEWVPPPDEAVPEPKARPAPVQAAEPEAVRSAPEPVVAEPEPEPEPEALAAAPAVVPAPVPEPEPLPEPEPEPEPEPIPEPKPLPEPEPKPAPKAAVPDVAARPPVEAEPETTITGRKRFADRLKQGATADSATPAQVPLRSTWKSKAEIAAAAAAAVAPLPEPEPEVEAPSVVVERAPVAEVAPVHQRAEAEATPAQFAADEPEIGEPEIGEPETGEAAEPEPEPEPAPVPAAAPPVVESDDERITRMIAAAAAQVQRSPRERLSRADRALLSDAAPTAATAEPKPAADASDLRARLFGARRSVEPPAATDLPAAAPAAAPEPIPEPPPAAPSAPLPRVAIDRGRFAERGPRAPAPPITNVPMGAAAPRAEPLQQGGPRTERRERTRVAARAVAAPAAPAPQSVSATELSLVDEAIGLIIRRAAALADEIDPVGKVPVDLVLDHGRETTEQLITLLSRSAATGLRRINADLGEVLDLIMLMQLEKGHAPADDALTVLLQLRRELETLRAS